MRMGRGGNDGLPDDIGPGCAFGRVCDTAPRYGKHTANVDYTIRTAYLQKEISQFAFVFPVTKIRCSSV